MERALGPNKTTDRIVEALTQTLALLKDIESAQANNESEDLRGQARKLQEIADEIGLLAIAEAAASLEHVGVHLRNEEISHLQRQVSATWEQLANAYPDISLNHSRG